MLTVVSLKSAFKRIHQATLGVLGFRAVLSPVTSYVVKGLKSERVRENCWF